MQAPLKLPKEEPGLTIRRDKPAEKLKPVAEAAPAETAYYRKILTSTDLRLTTG